MGGIIILASILIPTILFADILNVLCNSNDCYYNLAGLCRIYGWLYKSVQEKKQKGLAGTFKILGQVVLGLIVGITLYLSKDVVIREKTELKIASVHHLPKKTESTSTGKIYVTKDVKTTKTTIPFLKNNEFDYTYLIWFLGDKAKNYSYLIYIIMVFL